MKFRPIQKLVIAFAVGSASISNSAEFIEIRGVKEFTGELIVRPVVRATEPITASLYLQAATLLKPNIKRYSSRYDYFVVKVPPDKSENTYAAQLSATGLFEYVHPNYRLFPLYVPNDPQLGVMWHHAHIESYKAWDISLGEGVTIGFADSGLYAEHVELQGRVVPGYNSVDRLPQVLGGQVSEISSWGHGTGVTGGAVMREDNGLFGCGVSPRSMAMPVRITNRSGGGDTTFEAMHEGAGWAAENGAKVVMVAFTGAEYPSNETCGQYLRSLGSVFLYSVHGWAADEFDHPSVTIVAASNASDSIPSTSTYGRAIDVFAPGVNIYTINPWPSSFGVSASGTSIATSLAAGVLALIFSVNPDLSPESAEKILFYSSQDMLAPGDDVLSGFGRINSNRAVRLAKRGRFALDPSNHIYYEFVDANLNHLYSELAAGQRFFGGMSGSLAEVQTEHVNDFLLQNFGAEGPFRLGAKLGQTGWQWSSGISFGYANWAPGQPSGGDDDTLVFNVNGDGRWYDVPSASNAVSGFLVEYVSSPVNLQVNVELADFANDASEPVSVKFYWNGELVDTQSVTGGTATISTPLRGNLTALIEASHWLDRVVHFTMTGDPEVINVTMINGDADGDNEIGSSDLSIVSTGFLSVIGDPNYVANADFDGDGEIGSSDLSILSANFLTSGDSL